MWATKSGLTLGMHHCFFSHGLSVFFRCRRTLSWESDSTSPNSTALPARARSVQWSYPLGAGVQASSSKSL